MSAPNNFWYNNIMNTSTPMTLIELARRLDGFIAEGDGQLDDLPVVMAGTQGPLPVTRVEVRGDNIEVFTS